MGTTCITSVSSPGSQFDTLVRMKEVLMSSNISQAGVFAGSEQALKAADLDSVGGCGAPHAESRSEGIQGAPPSNTAPHNSKQPTPDSFRLLRLGVDSLYLSYSGELHPESLATLNKLKAFAQSEHSEEQAKAQWSVGSHFFRVHDKGARLFPFILDDNAYRIQIARPGKKLPMAYVKVSAQCLAHKGPQAVQEELHAILSEFGSVGANLVSRIDLAADFTSPVVMDSWGRSAWVTRASEIHNYSKDQKFTGWAIGLGGHIGCRLYDKVREIAHSGKVWNYDLWAAHGWVTGEEVWRLEFQFEREFLKTRQLSNLDSVLARVGGLWGYAMTGWLRLTVPNSNDATRTRWPTHHLWSSLTHVDWGSAHEVLLDRYSNARTPTELRLISVVLGALSSYMAMHGIDDRNDAIDALLRKLYEHYTEVARKREITFDEYLALRAALKAREFNTADNAPGLVDNLKQDFKQEGAEAYRRASRGW
jgi:hypothetical protein